jgi:hypothetical protein
MLLMVLGMSVLVLAIDFSIKGAILEESLKLRREIQSWKVTNGTKPEGRADLSGTANGTNDGSIPGDVLDIQSSGMEAGSSANGAAKPPSSSRQRRADPGAKEDTPGFQPGSE